MDKWVMFGVLIYIALGMIPYVQYIIKGWPLRFIIRHWTRDAIIWFVICLCIGGILTTLSIILTIINTAQKGISWIEDRIIIRRIQASKQNW